MPNKSLNERQFKALSPKTSKQYTVGNLGEKGLSASISYGGSKVFYFRYAAPITGKRSRIKIGAYPAWSLARARERARQLRVLIDQGEDPRRKKIEDKRKAHQERIQTVGDIWDDYRKRIGSTQRSADFYLSIWLNHVSPTFSNMNVEDFDRNAILDFLDRMRAEKSAPIANRSQGLITRLATHAVERRVLNVTPALNLGKKPREDSRERVLSDSEVALFWNYLSNPGLLSATKMSPIMTLVLRLCLLTACRRSEVAGAMWC